MREGFRHHIALRLLLQPVVADGGSGIEALLDVAILEDLGGGICLLRPDAGEAVGLQLHLHREGVGVGLGGAHAGLGDLVGNAEQTEAAKASFGVFSENGKPDANGNYPVNHTATVFLMGKNGEFEGTIDYGENKDSALAKIKRLIGT